MSQQAGDEVLVTTGDLQQHSATLKAELSELVSDQCSQVADKLSSQISAEVFKISELLAELQKSRQPGNSSAVLIPPSTQPPRSPSYNPLFAAPRGSPASGSHSHSPARYSSVATQTEVSKEDSDSEGDCEANDWFTVDSEFPELRLFAPFIEPGIQAPPQNDPIYPHIYPLIADTTLERITERKHKAAASEYKYLVCYGFYLSTSVAALKATLAAGVRPSSARERLQKLLRAFEAIEDHHRARLAHVRISRSDEAGGSKTLADVFQQIHLSEEPAALGSARFAEFATSFRRQEAASLIAQAAKLTAQKKIGAANKPAAGRQSRGRRRIRDPDGEEACKGREEPEGQQQGQVRPLMVQPAPPTPVPRILPTFAIECDARWKTGSVSGRAGKFRAGSAEGSRSSGAPRALRVPSIRVSPCETPRQHSWLSWSPSCLASSARAPGSSATAAAGSQGSSWFPRQMGSGAWSSICVS